MDISKLNSCSGQSISTIVPSAFSVFLEHFKPVGRISGEADIRRSPAGKWYPENLVAVFEEGEAEFHKFRYPVKSIRAEIRQRPDQCQTNAQSDSAPDVLLDVKATGWPVVDRDC